MARFGIAGHAKVRFGMASVKVIAIKEPTDGGNETIRHSEP